MQLAITFDVGCHTGKQLAGRAHLAGGWAVGRAVVRVRQKGHLGRQAKTLHFFGGHQRDGGQLFGVRVFVDVGVGDEQRLFVEHQRVECGKTGCAFFQADDVAHVFQVVVVTAHQATQQCVSVTQVHHQCADEGVGPAYRCLGGLGCHTPAAHQAVVGLPVLAEAGVVFGVADLHVHAGFDAQARLGDAGFNHGGASDQDGFGELVVHHHLHRAQHTVVFTFGVHHTFGLRLGSVEHRAHEHAGLVHKPRQAFTVRSHVFDGAGCHTGVGSGLRHGGGNLQDQARVERGRDQVVGAKHQLLSGVGCGHLVAGLGLGQVGNLAHTGQLHFFGDLGCAAVECAAEDVGETQHVVDLVRIVRTARGDDAVRPRGLGQLGADFRLGVGQRQDDRLACHGLDHLDRQRTSSRAAQEHVGVLHHIGQRAGFGLLRIGGFGRVQSAGAAFINDTLGVTHEDVFTFHAQAHHHVHAGNGCSARARHGHLDLFDLFVDQFQPVEQRSRRDDGCAMLVVMEHRNVHALAQLLLDVETLGCLDVFEVDPAQRGLHGRNDLDEFVGVVFGQLNIKHINTGKLLEQATFAFHHRLGRQRADVAQAQHGGAVGDHTHQVAARCVLGGFARVGFDVEARVGHTG